MKQLFLVILSLFFGSNYSNAQSEIQFFHGTWEEAIAKAQKENKMLFVDFYATWCAPCKFMTASVFNQSEVAAIYNANFINLKIDAEKQEQALVKQLKITGYPTLAYFKPNGVEFFRKMGGIDAANFASLGYQIVNFESNKKNYYANPTDINAIGPYVSILYQIDQQEAQKIADNYLKTIKTEDAKLAANWGLIINFDQNPNSRFFKYAVENFKYFLDSLPGFQDYFGATSSKLLQQAIDQKNETSLNEYKRIAQSALDQMGMDSIKGFGAEVDVYYYEKTEQKEKHLDALDHWLLNYVTDIELISNTTTGLCELYGEMAYPYCMRWAQRAIDLQRSSYTFLTMSFVFRARGMKTEALKYATTAMELAGPEDDKSYIQQFIDEIKAMK